ncbi:MAG: kinase [Gammaproteobacteria bacterium]|nr:kinase [Gammaproteobacteria bacterium]
MPLCKIKALDGSDVEFMDDEVIGSGAMKEVYFSPCKSYVVAFYREPLDYASRERLEMITGRYRQSIFNNEQGEYWKRLFCWPEKIVEYNGLTGIVVPTYQAHFFFDYGSVNDDFLNIKGKEKQGKWFASANNQNRFLDDREKGDWLSYLRICLMIARAVRRMHAAGLAHSDLSYKNVLVSPVTGDATIIDVDGLVVPGKYPPDVVGTPDFIAPEVVSSAHLSKEDPQRKLPNISTDRHALAVLIYNYLLLRHPLRGDKVHHLEPQKDEVLAMGEKALFIEHPTNLDNRVKIKKVKPSELPWRDISKLPYTITGPYLSELFERAFIHGLHEPQKRPTADEWENALISSIDLTQPCANKGCKQKWFIFDNSTSPKCPFCGTSYKGLLPVINFYSERAKGRFISDNHRLMVYSNQSLFPWHTNRLIQPNERLSDKQKHRQGYFVLHNHQWYLVNEHIKDLMDVQSKQQYPVGSQIKITDGLQLLTGKEPGDRLFHIQMVEG